MRTATIKILRLALAVASGLCFCLPACGEGQRDAESQGIEGRQIILCAGTTVAKDFLHAYLPATQNISGIVKDVGTDASPFALQLASEECSHVTTGLAAFSVATASGEVWVFKVGSNGATTAQGAFIPIDFLKGQSVKVLFRQTPRFGSAYGIVVRNEIGRLLLAVDQSGVGQGLIPEDVPEVAVTRGAPFVRSRINEGIIDQTHVSFRAETAISVRPGAKAALRINAESYVAGVGTSFTYVRADATDTSDVMSWFVSAGTL